jgi:hypothetical protein
MTLMFFMDMNASNLIDNPSLSFECFMGHEFIRLRARSKPLILCVYFITYLPKFADWKAYDVLELLQKIKGDTDDEIFSIEWMVVKEMLREFSGKSVLFKYKKETTQCIFIKQTMLIWI